MFVNGRHVGEVRWVTVRHEQSVGTCVRVSMVTTVTVSPPVLSV